MHFDVRTLATVLTLGAIAALPPKIADAAQVGAWAGRPPNGERVGESPMAGS
jgi:hypothetical protein